MSEIRIPANVKQKLKDLKERLEAAEKITKRLKIEGNRVFRQSWNPHPPSRGRPESICSMSLRISF